MVDGDVTNITNQAPLATYVRRASNIMDERDALNEDLREVIAEAKEAGYESKILREVIREHRPRSSQRPLRDPRYLPPGARALCRHAAGASDGRARGAPRATPPAPAQTEPRRGRARRPCLRG